MSLPNLGALRAVAARLEQLRIPYAFVGGSIVNLLLDVPELSPARPTDDVDVIIEVLSPIRYSDVEARLRNAGFTHDMSPGAPQCRWILGNAVVDIMPTDGTGLGLNTAWFPEALATARQRTIGQSRFNVITPEAFLATKLIAYRDRGGEDIHGSKDLEDLMTVIDGREMIVAEVDATLPALRAFIIGQIQRLIKQPGLRDALPGFLPATEELRVTGLRRKLELIAKLQPAGG